MTEQTKEPDTFNDGRVADATDNNWVDRFCPRWSRPYLRLSRADRPAGTWLLLIPCWWGLLLAIWADGGQFTRYDAWLAVAFGLGAFLMRGAGCTWNDISDREIDAQVARTKSRPIPSGQVTVRQAFVWMVIQTMIAFAILLTFNWFSVLLSAAALIPLLIYPFAKRFTWWPQLFLGVAINWGALLGWAVHFGELSWPPFLLYLAGIVWTLFYDTIYALQDIEDDEKAGVKSTARLFGDHVKKYLMWFLIVQVIILIAAFAMALADNINALSAALAFGTIWGFGLHQTWQLRRLDVEDPETCKLVFRSNRETGLIIVIGLILAISLQIGLSPA